MTPSVAEDLPPAVELSRFLFGDGVFTILTWDVNSVLQFALTAAPPFGLDAPTANRVLQAVAAAPAESAMEAARDGVLAGRAAAEHRAAGARLAEAEADLADARRRAGDLDAAVLEGIGAGREGLDALEEEADRAGVRVKRLESRLPTLQAALAAAAAALSRELQAAAREALWAVRADAPGQLIEARAALAAALGPFVAPLLVAAVRGRLPDGLAAPFAALPDPTEPAPPGTIHLKEAS